MSIPKFLAFLILGTVLFSNSACKPSAEKNEEAGGTADQRPSIYTAKDGHTIGMNVELNKGAKWEANVETTRGIDMMRGLLIDFKADPTVEDYRALHKKLAVEFQHILQRCTMTGEAHTQLHNYLMPLKEKIDFLGTGKLNECNALLPELKEYVMKYSHFFFS